MWKAMKEEDKYAHKIDAEPKIRHPDKRISIAA
jgi:hypothetical protein